MQRHPSALPFLVHISNEAKHMERFAVRSKVMTLRPDGELLLRVQLAETSAQWSLPLAPAHVPPCPNKPTLHCPPRPPLPTPPTSQATGT